MPSSESLMFSLRSVLVEVMVLVALSYLPAKRSVIFVSRLIEPPERNSLLIIEVVASWVTVKSTRWILAPLLFIVTSATFELEFVQVGVVSFLYGKFIGVNSVLFFKGVDGILQRSYLRAVWVVDRSCTQGRVLERSKRCLDWGFLLKQSVHRRWFTCNQIRYQAAYIGISAV